jgi:hypothetical protein
MQNAEVCPPRYRNQVKALGYLRDLLLKVPTQLENQGKARSFDRMNRMKTRAPAGFVIKAHPWHPVIRGHSPSPGFRVKAEDCSSCRPVSSKFAPRGFGTDSAPFLDFLTS